MKISLIAVAAIFAAFLLRPGGTPPQGESPDETCALTCGGVELTEEEWREKLSPEAFRILREHGTERPFTGKYWNHTGDGTFHCAGCETALFSSSHKFDSGTGWPSFTRAIDPVAVGTQIDRSHGMVRTEVHCATCKGHLGHIFQDGPPPERTRYCINSVAIAFREQDP